ncbi:MAG: hypothetical protein LBD86_01980 [Spirochaetaceae bacterium]|jgi:tetratricopeptide (TPR) repeat protein|nr:hypothetical protein [Spirochaetaceae bacterium]
MIQVTFSIKYQSQLRRIHPELYKNLEDTIVNSIKLYGGNVKYEFTTITALFNEEGFGFWLDILLIVETLLNVLDAVKHELYGYTCIISELMDIDRIHEMLNALPSVSITSGIWCTRLIRNNTGSFMEFDEPYNKNPVLLPPGSIAEVKSIKSIKKIKKRHPLRKSISTLFRENNIRGNSVLTGKGFIGKSDFIHWYCRNFENYSVPLTIRFGSWGFALNCFSDALNPDMRRFFESKNIPLPKETDALYEALSIERIRGEYSGYSLQKARRVFQILLEAYNSAVSAEQKYGVIILENIQDADSNMRQLIMDFMPYYEKNNITLYASCNLVELPTEWQPLFSSVINCLIPEIDPVFQPGTLNISLLEIAYACTILRQYFPPFMFPDLFMEEGKNPATTKRSLDMLLKYGLIRSKDDPECEITGFFDGAGNLPDARASYIRGMAARLLVSYTSKGKITPCFNLLNALYSLGGEISPILALEAIRKDVINDTCRDIETALAEERFDKTCGKNCSPALYYIYKTSKILLYGDETGIRDTFSGLHIPKTEISNYKVQILTINAFYKMGIRDPATAFEEMKESMIICQNSQDRYCMAQVYRLFAFGYLLKNELNTAIDYLSFAIEASERSGNNVELALVSYYAAGCNFIFGNISKAQRLIKQSERVAGISGMEKWAMRAKFSSGRFYFETGCYDEALEIFNGLYRHYGEDPYSSQAQTVSAWIFRTELYLYGRAEKREFILGDGLFFEIEAAYFSGDFSRVLELSNVMLASLPDDGFLFLEQPDWSSGFAQCEMLQIPKKDFWFRMVTAWRSLALYMLDSNGSEEAVQLMQKVIRDRHLSETDPSVPFLFFINYKVLHSPISTEIDGNTAISIALKSLQRRSSRIDDIEVRRNYLSKQYWNKELYLTAKKHKLV